jgi:hypothetical protein
MAVWRSLGQAVALSVGVYLRSALGLKVVSYGYNALGQQLTVEKPFSMPGNDFSVFPRHLNSRDECVLGLRAPCFKLLLSFLLRFEEAAYHALPMFDLLLIYDFVQTLEIVSSTKPARRDGRPCREVTPRLIWVGCGFTHAVSLEIVLCETLKVRATSRTGSPFAAFDCLEQAPR